MLVILIIRPSHAGYEGTFRVVAYASVIQLASWLAAIPILGILVLIAIAIYGVVLSVIGIREIHATTTGRAVAVVLIPAIIFALLALLIASPLWPYWPPRSARGSSQSHCGTVLL